MDGGSYQEKATALRPLDRSRRELVSLLEQTPPGSKQSEIARRRIELFDAQHDNTGSWKGEYFGRDMGDDLRERGFELDADGVLPVNEEDKQTHYMLVNMGELDRVNALGDHASGDRALEETTNGIRLRLGKVLDESQYEVYRYAGNDFSVRLKKVDREMAEQLTRALCGSVDITKALNTQDHAPIEASLASQSDMVDIINKLAPNEREALISDERPEGVAITVMKELLQQQNDRQKIESRMRRMQEIIEKEPDKASDFYDKYQKKILGELFREGNEKTPDFKTFLTRFTATNSEARSRLAMEEARRQHAGRRESQQGINLALLELAAKEKLEGLELKDVKPRIIIPLEAQQEKRFEPPKPTRGFVLIEEKRAIYEKLKQAGAEPEDTELAQLDYEIERANRDRMTGLAERGRMFHALESGLEQGKTISSIYIDMAFLKYFDKEGNGETGNVAIKKAAELLDGIAADASKKGIQVEVYRVGGDEFAFSVIGGDAEAVSDVLEMIRDRELNAPAISLQGDKALGDYYKQKLHINFGTFGPMNQIDIKEYLKKNNIPIDAEPGSPEERNKIAEYAIRIADKQLEIQKGENRIRLLIEKINDAKNKKISEDEYHQLLKYSQKAIFGKAGEEFIDQLANNPEDITNEKILKFVIDNIKIKNRKKDAYETSIDRFIDQFAHEMYFEQQIKGLQSKLESTRSLLQEAKDENSHLREQIQRLEEEIRSIAEIKERILRA